VQQAKDHLATLIVAEAQQTSTPLTDIERKMLYFSSGRTTREMKSVAAAFDREYNESDYEAKIALLIARIEAGFQSGDSTALALWDSAFERLASGDHYLSVLRGDPPSTRKAGSFWEKTFALVLLFAAAIFFRWAESWLHLR